MCIYYFNGRGTFFDGVSYRYIENFKDEFGDIYHVLYKSEDFKTDQDFGKIIQISIFSLYLKDFFRIPTEKPQNRIE